MGLLLDDFLRYLGSERRYSTHTQTAYASDLRALDGYIQAQFHFSPLTDAQQLARLSPPLIKDWMASEVVSRRSLARKVSALKAFLKYCQRKGIITHNPAAGIQVKKTGRHLPSFAKVDELAKLLDGTEWPAGWLGARDKLVLELLYGCGLRRAELIGLERAQVDLEGKTLRVLGKGKKQRLIPFGRSVQQAIEAYQAQAVAEALPQHERLLVCTEKGKPLYAKLVYSIVTHYLGQLPGLQKHSPHVLRHSYATHLVDNGADLNAVKELLGHSSLAATQVYVHNSLKKLKETYRKAHPKAES